MNPIFLADFYKFSHIDQYPEDTVQIWSNWTPRSSRIEGQNHVVHFGLQYFIKRVMLEKFRKNFFDVPLDAVLTEYSRVVRATLKVEPRVDHIEALWRMQDLPLKIYSLPEGTQVPLNVPALVITNTHPDFFWLPNYFETMLSMYLWKASTSATTAQRYLKLFRQYARQAGHRDLSFCDWQGHDFSMRGMSGLDDAVLSGMGHLTCFNGTDTVPAILAAERYYGADIGQFGSVAATEHSVMCAGGKDEEFETFRRLIEDIYPSGIVSIVSDTWDLWQVLTDYVPRLKDKILARDGKIVIRPDSGDPVKIICGDVEVENTHPAFSGTIKLLAQVLGVEPTEGGFQIRKGGAIYGDSITPARAEAILQGLISQGMSPFNMVFGIGSFTYEYCTRDTYGFAMKATARRTYPSVEHAYQAPLAAIARSNEIIPMWKKPITDSGGKFSHKGIPAVYECGNGSVLYVKEQASPKDLDDCAFKVVFQDGDLNQTSFAEIRERVRSCC